MNVHDDCVMSEWTQWGKCPSLVPEANHIAHEKCKNTGKTCCRDCVMSEWKNMGKVPVGWRHHIAYEKCKNTRQRMAANRVNRTGGENVQRLRYVRMDSMGKCRMRVEAPYRVREGVKNTGSHVDFPCEPNRQEKTCRDCKVGEWAEFSPCPKGGGKRIRLRKVTQTETNGGKSCKEQNIVFEESLECADCRYSEWGNFTPCIQGYRSQTKYHCIS